MPYEFLEAAVLSLTFFSAKTQHSTLHPRQLELHLEPGIARRDGVFFMAM
ncbi:hypothetical protein CSC35_3253 [Enterobacter hormaechei]|nr:hypothetical protein CSC35_3253 [Enterobacter hormaechei]